MDKPFILVCSWCKHEVDDYNEAYGPIITDKYHDHLCNSERFDVSHTICNMCTKIQQEELERLK